MLSVNDGILTDVLFEWELLPEKVNFVQPLITSPHSTDVKLCCAKIEWPAPFMDYIWFNFIFLQIFCCCFLFHNSHLICFVTSTAQCAWFMHLWHIFLVPGTYLTSRKQFKVLDKFYHKNSCRRFSDLVFIETDKRLLKWFGAFGLIEAMIYNCL